MTAETAAPHDGCARECSEGHTYEWGRCEQGIQLPPTLFAARTAIAGDGEVSAGFDGFPLALLLPWTVHLPVAEQHEMLEELADALPEDRNAIFADWYATAVSLSDPTRRDILLGKSDPADFVKADRPFATGGIVGAGALPILGAGCTYPMPSRADIEADRAVLIKMRSPGDAKADTEPGGSFWADLRQRLRDEPEFRKGYIETLQQIQALDDAANAQVLTCPFCRIVSGTSTTQPFLSWDDAVAITPLNPVVPGHMLVIPNRHVADAAEDPDVTGAVMRRAAELAAGRGDMNLITSIGPAATQTVRHLHIHLVPRTEGDGLTLPWTGQERSA